MSSQEWLRREEYAVRDVPLVVAQSMVESYHYARGGANTGTFTHGLFHDANPHHPVGVAWWIPPTRTAAEATWDGDWRRVLSLSRIVVEPGQPTNAASFLIAHSIRLIREDGFWRCLVTYADEWQGHMGAIYRATNWEYMGLTGAESTWVDSNGRMVARKAGPVTRTQEEMIELGYRCVGRFRKHKYRKLIRPIPERHRTHQPSLLEFAS